MNHTEGILICGHGSPDKRNVNAFLEMVEKVKTRYPEYLVHHGFLEISGPTFGEAVSYMVTAGVRTIYALPWFLFRGVHLDRDIPLIFKEIDNQYPGVNICLGKEIGMNPETVSLSKELISTELNKSRDMDITGTGLLVAGVGSSLTATNAEIARLSRMLWEAFGFGISSYGFISSVTYPSVDATIQSLYRLGYQTILLHPVLFFSGFYMHKLSETLHRCHAQFNIRIQLTGTYESHDQLLAVLDRNLSDLITGRVNMLSGIPAGLQPRKK